MLRERIRVYMHMQRDIEQHVIIVVSDSLIQDGMKYDYIKSVS